MRIMVAVFLLIGMLSATVYGEEKMKIGVMEFEAMDVPRTEALKISELIRNEMLGSGQYTVLERAQVDKILQEQGYQVTGCTDVACAVQVGKLLSARKILVGTIMKYGDNIAVTGKVVDVEKGIAEFAEKERAVSKDDVFNMVERLCNKLTMRITGKSIEITANKHYTQGSMKMNTSYEPIKDPTGWLALGSSLASVAGFVAGYLQYETRIGHIDDKYSERFTVFFLSQGSSAGYYAPPFLISQIYNSNKDKRQAGKSRNNIYIASGAIGGFAIIMFGAFVGRFVTNALAVNNNGNSNSVAVYIAPQYLNPVDWTKRNGFGFGLGLMMKL